MADPRPLFYVTAVVVAGLVVWVLSVLLRAGRGWKLAPASPKPGEPLARSDKESVDAADVGPEAAAEEASASAALVDRPADHESPKNS